MQGKNNHRLKQSLSDNNLILLYVTILCIVSIVSTFPHFLFFFFFTKTRKIYDQQINILKAFVYVISNLSICVFLNVKSELNTLLSKVLLLFGHAPGVSAVDIFVSVNILFAHLVLLSSVSHLLLHIFIYSINF